MMQYTQLVGHKGIALRGANRITVESQSLSSGSTSPKIFQNMLNSTNNNEEDAPKMSQRKSNQIDFHRFRDEKS